LNRKAAIEMSMNTIIVIVIGVVLLSLGLVFVRSIFSGVSEISQGAFEEAQSALGGLGQIDSLLTISPLNIKISQSADKGIGVVVFNTLETPLKYHLEATPGDKDLNCVFSVKGGMNAKTDEKTLASGGKNEYILLVKENGGSLRTTSCYIEVIGDTGGEENTGSVIVRVE